MTPLLCWSYTRHTYTRLQLLFADAVDCCADHEGVFFDDETT